MKKLITKLMALVAILLLSAWNVNAQTGVTLLNTNFEDWKSTIGTDQANGIFALASATLTIQGPKFNNSSTPNAGTNATYPNYFRFGSAGSLTNNYLDITPTNAFVNGGKITLIISTNANPTATNVFSVGDKDLASVSLTDVFAEFNQIGKVHTEVSVVLPTTFTGIKTIRVFRTATTTFLHAIKIETNPAAPSITAFTAAGISATIDENAKTITAELPYGTSLTSIEPSVTIGGTATSYSPTGAQDFSAGAVTYTATEGANNVNYAVTLTASAVASSDKDLSNVTIGGFTPVFNSETNAYSVVLPKASSLSQAVVFTKPITANADFTSGDMHNFASPLSITVTAQDASTKEYTLSAVVGTKNIAYVTSTGNSDPYLLGSLISSGYWVEEIIAGTQTSEIFANHDLAILFDVVNSANTLALNMKDLIGTKRFLNLKAFMYGKTGWPTGAGVNVTTERVANIQSNYVTHPIFTGLTLSDTETTLVESTVSGNGLQGVTTPGAGTVIATLKSNAAAASIIEDNSVESAMYLMIGFSNGATTALANINADGKKLLDNAVAYLLGDAKFIPLGTGFSAQTLNSVTFDGKIIRNNDRQELLVFNSTGRLIVRSTEDINMASQPKGVYFVKSSGGTIKIALTR